MRQFLTDFQRYLVAAVIIALFAAVPPMSLFETRGAYADENQSSFEREVRQDHEEIVKAMRDAEASAVVALKAAALAAQAANGAAAEIRKLRKTLETLVRQDRSSAKQRQFRQTFPQAQQRTASGNPTVFRVGSKFEYKSPSAVARLVRDGDTVEIAAEIYEGDVANWRANNLTLRGVGGRAHLMAKGRSAGGKAIWVIQGDNNVVENIEFSGTRVDDNNGAGIRLEGTGLIIRNSYFHDNEMGILTGPNPHSDIVIEGSEFSRNFADYKGTGSWGHNIYIGQVRSFTLRNSYIHHAAIGHNVKSRARVNRILYNRLMDGHDGNSSYIVDFPNGGTAYLIGNVMQQSRYTDNSTMINFASVQNSPADRLYLFNNTLVDELGSGGFVQNRSPGQVLLVNNILAGKGKPLWGPGSLSSNLIARWPGQGKIVPAQNVQGNLIAERAGFRDPENFDYSLVKGSPAIDAGVDPKPVGGEDMTPSFEYRHPRKMIPRKRIRKLDIGALEFGEP